MKTSTMQIKLVDIDSVIPYDKNPRKNAKAIGVVAASIGKYGFRQPIVVDRKSKKLYPRSLWGGSVDHG